MCTHLLQIIITLVLWLVQYLDIALWLVQYLDSYCTAVREISIIAVSAQTGTDGL